MVAPGKHSYFQRKKKENRKEKPDKARMKSSRANIKYCSSMSSIWGAQWRDVAFKNFGSSVPMNLLGAAPMATCLDWLCLLPVASFSRYSTSWHL